MDFSKTLVDKFAYIFVHFAYSTDNELSVEELKLISTKINDLINENQDNYRQTYSVVTQTLAEYINLTLSQRSTKCNVLSLELNRDLSPVQKSSFIDSLNELAELDSLFQSEIDFINDLKSKFKL